MHQLGGSAGRWIHKSSAPLQGGAAMGKKFSQLDLDERIELSCLRNIRAVLRKGPPTFVALSQAKHADYHEKSPRPIDPDCQNKQFNRGNI
jgi:hypothetical protein